MILCSYTASSPNSIHSQINPLTPRNLNNSTIHKPTPLPQQENNHIRNLLCLAHPPQRNPLPRPLNRLRPSHHRIVRRRIHRPRRHRIHPDPLRPQLRRQRLRQPYHAELRRAVHRVAREPLQAAYTGHVDDRGPARHHWRAGSRDVKRSAEVDVDESGEVVVCRSGDGDVGWVDACAVEEGGELEAVSGDDPGDRGAGGAGGDVEGEICVFYRRGGGFDFGLERGQGGFVDVA